MSGTRQGRPAEHERAHQGLLALVWEAGDAVPCLGPGSAAWVSDAADAVAAAVVGCRVCPVLDRCRGYAVAVWEPAGVWGGLTPDELKRAHQREQYRATARKTVERKAAEAATNSGRAAR